MDYVNKNYFDGLPLEMKLKILSYLSSVDLINIATIPSLEDLTYEAPLIRKISFYKTARFDDFNFLTNVNRRELITSLNITGVYWIAPCKLSEAISKLVNLKSLYAIGSQFGKVPEHFQILAALSQLDTLSLTIHLVISEICVKVRNLYLDFSILGVGCIEKMKFNTWGTYEKLWIINSPFSKFTEFRAEIPLNESVKCNLQEFGCYMCRVKDLPSHLDMTFLGSAGHCTIYKKCIDKGQYNWDIEDNSWARYLRLIETRNTGIVLPVNYTDTMKMYYSPTLLPQLEYTELNIRCYNQIAQSGLMKENMKKLKKLSVSLCICHESDYTKFRSSHKSRQDISNVPLQKSSLECIVLNCLLIEELEIWECHCNKPSTSVTEESMMCISELKNLKKLSLNDLPTDFTGMGLWSLCCNLPNLTSLKIQSSNDYCNLTECICLALADLPHLKDLRYETSFIDLNTFFDTICLLDDLKLERLVLMSETAEYKKGNLYLDKFLAKNRQLRFFVIRIDCLANVFLDGIFNKYKTSWHAYFVNPTVEEAQLLPIDKFEMFLNFTEVSVLNPFTHYVK